MNPLAWILDSLKTHPEPAQLPDDEPDMTQEQKRDSRGGPRIVINYRDDDGNEAAWRCLLCGAAVIHVDDHYAWHIHVDGILALAVFGETE